MDADLRYFAGLEITQLKSFVIGVELFVLVAESFNQLIHFKYMEYLEVRLQPVLALFDEMVAGVLSFPSIFMALWPSDISKQRRRDR